jgi:tubulin monoglycylase TTLL15
MIHRHFFEMMRFDFLVDDNLDVHLLEANMSPNLSSLHFKPNQALYEHVILNVLSLNRLLTLEATSQWPRLDEDKFAHRLATHELSVRSDLCASDRCRLSCQQMECQICTFCFSFETRLQIKDAILEHTNRFRQRRLLPNVRNSSLNSAFGVNPLHVAWFQAKCLLDSSWC